MKDHKFFALFKNSGISESMQAGKERQRGGERQRELFRANTNRVRQ